jgi:RNA polymerase sigma-70 factor (ECF subfamily)
VRAFADRRRFNLDEPDAAPWLFGIASNLLKRHWRSERRRWRAYARQAAETRATTERSEESAVSLAVSKLSRAERETVFLYVWADLDYVGVAQALNVPIGTVRSRLNRARKILRQQLAEVTRVDLKEALENG